MSDLNAHVVIIGAGHAGGTLAALLRQYGHTGLISMVGDEPIPPYQRPPLSKAWLKGEADADSLALRPLAFYGEANIDFRPSVRAVKLERSARKVHLSDGSELSYDFLVIATGARAIALPIPGADLKGVLSLRTAADAEALKAQVGPGKQLAVVGGGYIGLEVAASGRALGAEVVVLERETRLLARVANEVLSEFFRDYHQQRGVRFELGASVTGFGTVLQFWVGGNIGTKAATRALERAAAAPTTNVTAPAAATQIVNPNALDSSPRADLDIPPEPTP